MDKVKNAVVVIALIGGLMSMGTVVGGFVSAVVFYQELSRVMAAVNETDVDYYHKTLKPQHEELWKNRN
jgi:hypothetical protein